MKIVGLLIAKNEVDILPRMLDACSWMDGVYAIDNGSMDGTADILATHTVVKAVKIIDSEFNEGYLTRKLIELANGFTVKADWFVEIDADEIFPDLRSDIEFAHKTATNVITVDIKYMLNDRPYRTLKNWRRVYRNDPSLFDFEGMSKLHRGKIPIPVSRRVILDTGRVVKHYQIRSYEQGMRKYENYKRIDTGCIQTTGYDHLREQAEMYRTGDFSGVKFE